MFEVKGLRLIMMKMHNLPLDKKWIAKKAAADFTFMCVKEFPGCSFIERSASVEGDPHSVVSCLPPILHPFLPWVALDPIQRPIRALGVGLTQVKLGLQDSWLKKRH